MEAKFTFAERIKQLRSEKGLTLEEAGKLAGFSAQNWFRYEDGRVPKLDVAIKVARAFMVNPLWVMGFDVQQELPRNDVSRELTEGLVSVPISLVEPVRAFAKYLQSSTDNKEDIDDQR